MMEWYREGKISALGKKIFPLPLFSLVIPHWMATDRTRTLASSDRRITDWTMARAYLRFIMCRWQLKMRPLGVMSQRLQITGLLKTYPGNVCNGQTRCAGWSGWIEILSMKCAALKIILLVLRRSFQFSLWKPQRLGNWLYFLHQMGSIRKGIPALLGL